MAKSKKLLSLLLIILISSLFFLSEQERVTINHQFRKGDTLFGGLIQNQDNQRQFSSQGISKIYQTFELHGTDAIIPGQDSKKVKATAFQGQNLFFKTLPVMNSLLHDNQSSRTNSQIPIAKITSIISSNNPNLIKPEVAGLSSNKFTSFGLGSPNQDVYDPENPILKLKSIKRQSNGSNNNLKNPTWGAAKTNLLRTLPAVYLDNDSTPIDSRPDVRTISNIVGSATSQPTLSEKSLLFVMFGQFVDHDLDLTKEQQGQKIEIINIPIPRCDRFFDQYCSGEQFIAFKRAKFTSQNPRQFANQLTAFIDGGNVYGSDQTTLNALRSNATGQLTAINNGMLLINQKGLFVSGDSRVNQHAILTSLHVVFHREHNRICQIIERRFPNMSREQSFLIAKNFVIGLLQKITYDDYLPQLLGRDNYDSIVGKYQGYDQNINPSIPIEFSTAAFRFGHSQLVDKIPQINQYNKVLRNFNVEDLFFRPNLVTANSVGQFLKGAAMTKAKKKDGTIVNAVRNFLIPGADRRNVKLDLFALNVQRGRDMGLADYNTFRKAYGLKQVNNFSEFCNPVLAQKLRKAYGTVDNLDLWVGIVAQQPVSGGVVGQLGSRIIGNVFKNVRNGDRFWYEKTFPEQIVYQLKQTTLADVIKRNTDISLIQKNVFGV